MGKSSEFLVRSLPTPPPPASPHNDKKYEKATATLNSLPSPRQTSLKENLRLVQQQHLHHQQLKIQQQQPIPSSSQPRSQVQPQVQVQPQPEHPPSVNIHPQLQHSNATQFKVNSIDAWPGRGGPPKLLKKLERYVNDELRSLNKHNTFPNATRIKVFQQAFQKFIDEFKSYKLFLGAIKNEYDSLLSMYASKLHAIPTMQAEILSLRKGANQNIENLQQIFTKVSAQNG